MLRGIYTSAMGMAIQDKRLDVISNNLANVNTNGYKNDTTVFESFDSILTKRMNDTYTQQNPSGRLGHMPLAVDIGEIFTDYSQGKLISTDNNTDLAITESTNSFFTIEFSTEAGIEERYTRDGAFSINQDGVLVTKEGYPVKGENGQIILQNQDFIINNKGEVIQDGEVIDTLLIKTFEDTKSLRKIGSNLLTVEGQPNEVEFTGSIRQGFLEGSNVNTIREMIDMINVVRAYEANQKILKTQDETLGKAVNEIGVLR